MKNFIYLCNEVLRFGLESTSNKKTFTFLQDLQNICTFANSK